MHANETLTTFATASAIGVCLFIVARSLRVSAIVVLLIGGVVAGPQCLAIVNPTYLGDGLGTIISLAVAIILFEGGLTLDLKGYRSVSREILRILTVGVLVTWLGTAVVLKVLFQFDWDFCFLAASLIIVTGPTVIGPLLHRIRVQKNLHHILHWEGVLIDPIGVFVALLCFEYYVSTDGAHQLVVKDFLLRFVVGAAIGIAFGRFLDAVLRREWINKGHINIFVLAMAMLNFCIADLVIAESGLLSVTIAGLVLGGRNTPQLREIVSYKVELKDFLIGLLFVLLAANLDLRSFLEYGWKLVTVVVAIMLIVRPLNVFVSMRGSSLGLNEKLFLSWIAPRGIVAASMASVFALKLQQSGAEHAVFLETFTYSVIAGTVLVQGSTAGAVGHALRVVRPVPTGWIIVGAHTISRRIAMFLMAHGLEVVLIDTNARDVRAAERTGIIALSEDAMQMNPEAHAVLYGCGNFVAMTSNSDLNRMLCRRWSELMEGRVLRWEKAGYETLENRHLLTGERIWDKMPLDRWMGADNELPPLHVVQASDDDSPRPENVLFTVRGDSLLPGVPTELHPDDREWLVYDPEQGQHRLRIPLTPENVVFSNQIELSALYLEMLHHLHKQLPGIDPQQLFNEMWKREEEYTSLLGHGIALPHAWTTTVEAPTLMVARPQDDVVCPQTGRTISIVFMLLSPAGRPKEHLSHLSSIARRVGSQTQRQRILQATDSAELYRIIADS